MFRTRDLLVRQRTQLINAIRGHPTEYGWVAPKGPSHIAMLSDMLEGEMGSSLPDAARPMFRMMLELLEVLNGKIGELDKEIAQRAREDTIARRLMTIPGVGPITATAVVDVHQRTRLRSMAGSGTASALDGRQAKAWIDHEDG